MVGATRDRELGWGLLGVGEWIDQNVAPAIRQAKNSKLVALMSRDAARAEAFARYHAAERAHTSEDELLKDPEVDVIVIGTPNHLHVRSAIAAASHGKHIQCCAPMAVTTSDCVEMLEACRRNGVHFGMDFQHRYHPAFVALKRAIDDGVIGDVGTVRAQASIPWAGGHRGRQVWRVPALGAFAEEYSEKTMIVGRGGWKNALATRGAGILSGPGMLGLDTLRYVLDDEVDEVYARADITSTDDQESWVFATLTCRSGVLVNFECSRRTPFADNMFTVYGTKGRASAGGFTPWHSDGVIEIVTSEGTHRRELVRHNMYVDQIEAYAAAIMEGRAPSSSGIDGLREREITLAMRESALANRPVVVEHHELETTPVAQTRPAVGRVPA